MTIMKPYILFYDLETTGGEDCLEIIEYAGLPVRKDGFCELPQLSFSTLIKPEKASNQRGNLYRNGITWSDLKGAPLFSAVANRIFSLMDGHFWAGHNIINFDNKKIAEAFARLGRKPPRPAGLIDTYQLFESLQLRFRLGNLQLSTCGQYCSEPEQVHRSFSDVRLNIAVLKKLMTDLVLETMFPFLSNTHTPSTSLSSSSATSSSHHIMARVVASHKQRAQSQQSIQEDQYGTWSCRHCIEWRRHAVASQGHPALTASASFNPCRITVEWSTPNSEISGNNPCPQLMYNGQPLYLHDAAAKNVVLCLSPSAAAAVAACHAALTEAVEQRMGTACAVRFPFHKQRKLRREERQRAIQLRFPLLNETRFQAPFYECMNERIHRHCRLLKNVTPEPYVCRSYLPAGNIVDVVFLIRADMLQACYSLSYIASSVVT